jgi:anti-sigma factor
MKHPFYVNLSDKIKVMAHGTQFNISNYKHENTILMTLVSGAIDVYHGAKIQSALMPNEQCKYDRASGMFTNSAVNSTDYASWKDGKLVFHDTPLNVVLSQLSHRFNVKFRLHDRRRADYHVRATFENEDLHDMLQSLRSIIPIKWQDSPDMSGDNRRIIDLYID